MEQTVDNGSKGLTIVFTGNGKGKTTAALGLAMRASGHSMRVKVMQFIKNPACGAGEYHAALNLGVEILPLGRGFTWRPNSGGKDDIELTRKAWEAAQEILFSGSIDILVLDEITFPLQRRWLDVEEVLQTLALRPPAVHVVMTGRDAPERLIEAADLVTEMREVKHPFRDGILGQPGIEY